MIAPLPVLAFHVASDSSLGVTALSSPLSIVAWIIAYVRKREEIGGWLLYYFWSLYLGAALSLTFFAITFHDNVPEFWESPSRYHWHLAALVPVLVIFALQLAVATMLVSVRTPDMFRLFRWLQVGHLLFSVLAVIIETKFFPQKAPSGFVAAGAQTIWTAYLFMSRRVRSVFLTQNWQQTSSAWYPTTTQLMS